MKVPTRVISSYFLTCLRVIDEVHKNVGSVLVRLEAWLNWSLLGFQKGLNLHRILLFDFCLPGVENVLVNVTSVKCSVLLVEI